MEIILFCAPLWYRMAALAGLMTVAQGVTTVVTQGHCSYGAKSATSPATPLQPNKLYGSSERGLEQSCGYMRPLSSSIVSSPATAAAYYVQSKQCLPSNGTRRILQSDVLRINCKWID